MIFIVVADSGILNLGKPETPRFGGHRSGSTIPVVKRSDHGHLLCMGRPDAERHTIWTESRSHALFDALRRHSSMLLLSPRLHGAITSKYNTRSPEDHPRASHQRRLHRRLPCAAYRCSLRRMDRLHVNERDLESPDLLESEDL